MNDRTNYRKIMLDLPLKPDNDPRRRIGELEQAFLDDNGQKKKKEKGV